MSNKVSFIFFRICAFLSNVSLLDFGALDLVESRLVDSGTCKLTGEKKQGLSKVISNVLDRSVFYR